MWRLTYTFVCPLCCKQFRSDEPGEPCCTGPSEMRNDHPLEVMRLLRIDKDEVNPVLAERRAEGRLLMPSETEAINRDARIILGSR